MAAFVALASFASHGAAHRFTMILNYSGAVAYDVPTLIKISTLLIEGFDYDAAGDGTHFEIADENGAILPYEIDTWNPSDESLLWVKVPVFQNGRRLTVTYGETEADMTVRAAEVWSNYIGVWHMNAVNAAGKYPNAAGDARFDAEVSSFSRVGEAGRFGQSVLIYTNAAHLASSVEKGGVFIPDDGEFDLSGSFTLSAWLYHTAEAGNDNEAFRYDEIFCKRQHPRTTSDLNHSSTNGFGVRIGANAAAVGALEFYGSSTDMAKPTVWPNLTNVVWRHLGVVFDDGTASLWLDGVKKSANDVGRVTDNDEPLAFGNTGKAYFDNEGDRGWGGRMDEVRLYGGVSSDAYLAAEYAAMTGTLVIGSGTCSLEIDRDEHFDDAVTVTSDVPPDSEGKYPVGTTITLTAVPDATGTFRKWYGDVPREGWTNATVSFVIERDSWVYARFVHPWTLSADRTTMSNGHFTVNVSVLDEAAHTLTVGKTAEAGLSPESDTGVGTVDLGGPIRLAGDNTIWTIGKFANNRGSQSFPISREGPFRYLSPGTIVTRGTAQPFHCGDTGGNAPPLFGASYEMIILDEPSTTIPLFDDYAFTSQSDTRRLIVQEPKVGELCGVRVFGPMLLTDTRFDWWDISSVSKIPEGFFEHKWGGVSSGHGDGTLRLRVPIMGAISLPNLRGVGWRVDTTQYDGGTLLFLMPNVEEISLGGATEETTVTNLCTYAFAGDSSLRKLTLHAAPDMTVGTRIFADKSHNTSNGVEVIDGVTYSTGSQTSRGRVPDVIHFTGQAVSEEAISNLLADVPVVSAAAKPVVIHASRFQDGWRDNRRDWISNSTPAERAAYPGEKVIGVYRAGAEAPSGKAVIIHRDNDWDKGTDPGLFIRLR